VKYVKLKSLSYFRKSAAINHPKSDTHVTVIIVIVPRTLMLKIKFVKFASFPSKIKFAK